MNGVYYTIYNDIRDRDAGVKPVSRPNIPTAEQEYDEIKVPGRDGNLYRKKGTLTMIQDIEAGKEDLIEMSSV